MKEKSEVFTHFQNFRMLAEKQTGLQVKCLGQMEGENISPMSLLHI
jgi:hypothetical protein